MDKINPETKELKKEKSPLIPPFRKGEEKVVWSALSLAWELGYTIAIPIVVFALLGRMLDKWLNTSPWLLLVGIFLSVFISSFGVYYKTVKIMKDNK